MYKGYIRDSLSYLDLLDLLLSWYISIEELKGTQFFTVMVPLLRIRYTVEEPA